MREKRRSRPSDDCKDLPWVCGACENLLAFIDQATKSQVRIKHKELFVWVERPHAIRIVCRRCGVVNELVDLAPQSESEAPPPA